jgi:hypothetical protein
VTRRSTELHREKKSMQRPLVGGAKKAKEMNRKDVATKK